MHRLAYAEAVLTWEQAMDAKHGRFRYGIGADETREHYLERSARWHIFGIVKDGAWFERGEMGWWGIVSDKEDDVEWDDMLTKLIADLPDETLLTMVDCHI